MYRISYFLAWRLTIGLFSWFATKQPRPFIKEIYFIKRDQAKKINISILIAYLKLIRTKRHINILFLDEVFSSIDIEGIDSILLLLKSFANDYNINIFVVHHAILSQEMFDRILKVNKEVFTSIEEVIYE